MLGPHIERVRAGIFADRVSIADYICKHTFIRGEQFSFKDHEYQAQLAADYSPEIWVRKCSQIGISEFSVRRILSKCQLIPGYSVLYTLPTALFAGTFFKTRVDVVIDSSPMLSAAMHKGVDSASVKRFTNDSFIFSRGASGIGQALSIPIDELVHDEEDFSDQEVLSSFQSRLTHSKYKAKFHLSTPTVPGYGVSAGFDASKRYWEVLKCSHCNHSFIPDYYEHVVLPGWSKHLKELKKSHLAKIDTKKAYLKCPSCDRQPDMDIKYRQWICENPGDNFDAKGYQITPFSAPNIITIPYLVETSTKYKRRADFVNFNLGLPMEDAETTLSREEVLKCFVPGEYVPGTFSFMGVDLGGPNHIMIGQPGPDGKLVVVHSEKVPLSMLEQRYTELSRKYRVISTVVDSQPYTDMVMRLQKRDHNCWASVFVTSKDLQLYRIRETEEDVDKAMAGIRQLNVNRNNVLTTVVDELRSDGIIFLDSEEKEEIISHLIDMKRTKIFNQDDELEFRWQKSAGGSDHYMFTLLYLYLASRLRAISSNVGSLPFMMTKIKVKTEL